jgi:hypothetical protein
VIVPQNIYNFAWLAVQQAVLNPSLSPVNINTDTFSLIISNVRDGLCSSASAASDIDAISTLTILLLPRLAILALTPAIKPHSFRQNRHRYARRILTILRNCTDLVEVGLPLEFRGRNLAMILALKDLPDLSILMFRLPTTFMSTPRDIRRFQSLLAVHLRGFDQIEDIRLPIQLVNTFVLETLASLEQLQALRIVPTDQRDGETFASVLWDSAIQQSETNFRALNTVDIGLGRVPQSKKLSTVAIIKNKLPKALVI